MYFVEHLTSFVDGLVSIVGGLDSLRFDKNTSKVLDILPILAVDTNDFDELSRMTLGIDTDILEGKALTVGAEVAVEHQLSVRLVPARCEDFGTGQSNSAAKNFVPSEDDHQLTDLIHSQYTDLPLHFLFFVE